jgi:dynein heavy chain
MLNALLLVARVQMREKLVNAVDEIRTVMSSIYDIFRADSEEVQREWVRFTQKVDKKMEEALRHTIKKSLQVGRKQFRKYPT